MSPNLLIFLYVDWYYANKTPKKFLAKFHELWQEMGVKVFLNFGESDFLEFLMGDFEFSECF